MNNRLSTLALALLLGGMLLDANVSTAAPMRAADFIARQGVNLHISQGTSNYKKMDMVTANLAYLGIQHVRDSFNPFWNGPAYGYYTHLAQAGMKWTFISAVGGTRSPATIATFLNNISALERAVPGSVFAVEGPNEINNFPLTWEPTGQKGLDAALAFQQSLYGQTQASPVLKKAKVFYFTGYDAGSIPKGPDPTTTPGYSHYNNQHPYPLHGKPPARWIARSKALGNTPSGAGPAVYTETGYQIPKTSEAQAASWTLNLLVGSAANGIYRTYLYQLMDEGNGWGLFSKSTNQPTLAATAIHNMNSILADGGEKARTFTPTTLVKYSTSGRPATGRSFVVQKSDMETNILVWAEPDEFPGPETPVMVHFGAEQPLVLIYDPLEGSRPIQSLRNVSSAEIRVTDHPLIVQIPTATALALAKNRLSITPTAAQAGPAN
ncbi:hypothetical protein [Pseudomonas sp. GOM6]|uniref:hypothetical protein n=1 Tax=Pseudomonas sp. GOM6 TaxID=3036944 RepID=UPI00240A407B|nr:hypothetical protein [Pseudomonas sp. GOM6]MDG1582698.1 hypothetical protein [Pseudomonas sp. GOM6]